MSDKPADRADLVAFQIPPELMAEAQEALAAVREDPAHEPNVEALLGVVLELTDRGLDFYYLEPLRRARAGAMTTSAAKLGIAAAGRGIPPIIRRVISSLDEDQILEIADFIDEMLIPADGWGSSG